MRELKSVDYQILFELIKNPRLSDRQLAKILGVSQPTVTRKRAVLEKEGLLEYTAVPNLRKLGFEIIAFSFGRWDLAKYPDTRVEETRDFFSKNPNVIFLSTGRGLNWDRMGVSVHKDYSDYHKVVQDFKSVFGENLESFGSFIISLRSDNIVRDFTLKYLAELIKKEHEKKDKGT